MERLNMKWIVTETSVENTKSDFGPFNTMGEAIKFADQSKFPWSDDFLRSINIRKVADSHEIKPCVYRDPIKEIRI